MNELRDKLIYVRNMLLAMQKLNQDEEQLRNQIKNTSNVMEFMVENTKKRKKWIFIVIAVFLLIVVTSTDRRLDSLYDRAVKDYEYEVYLEELEWMVEHSEEGPYPGYDEPEPQKMDFLGKAICIGIYHGGVLAGILGGIVAIKFVIDSILIKIQNKRIREMNQSIIEKNILVESTNKKIVTEIEKIHDRKIRISEEYQKNIISWFPRDYGYLKAVDYFINLIDNHMATTIQEAVEQYRNYEYQQAMLAAQQVMLNQQNILIGNQEMMIGNQEVMIGNQKIMISNQEELVRQQMHGNMINSAILNVNSQVAYDMQRLANMI